jgi:hypothetical protein
MLTISSLDHIKSSVGILKQSIGTGNRFLEQGAEQESRERNQEQIRIYEQRRIQEPRMNMCSGEQDSGAN